MAKHKRLIFIGVSSAAGILIMVIFGVLFDVFYIRSGVVVELFCLLCLPALVAGKLIGHFFANGYVAAVAALIVQGILYGALGAVIAWIIFKESSEKVSEKTHIGPSGN